jgi:predicted RNase H-like nuclease
VSVPPPAAGPRRAPARSSKPRSGVPPVAGVDGVADRWVVAVVTGNAVTWSVGSAREVLAVTAAAGCVTTAVDIPIGLVRRGRRVAETEARRLLGPGRSSIFPTPPQPAFDVARRLGTGRGARAIAQAAAREAGGHGISTQTWGLAPKILEVEDALRGEVAAVAGRVVETHPETAFRVLDGAPPGSWPGKRSAAGAARRLRALDTAWGVDAGTVVSWLDDPALDAVPVDDAVDALAAAWSASRVAAGTAVVLGAGQADEAVWSDGTPARGRAVIVV